MTKLAKSLSDDAGLSTYGCAIESSELYSVVSKMPCDRGRRVESLVTGGARFLAGGVPAGLTVLNFKRHLKTIILSTAVGVLIPLAAYSGTPEFPPGGTFHSKENSKSLYSFSVMMSAR